MYRYFLDNQLTDQPDNDDGLITTIKRDSDLGGLLTTQEITLQYSGNNNLVASTISGYAYLKSKFDLGSCNEVEVEVYDHISATETYRVYTGVIKIPAIEIDEGYIRLSTKVDDNSFYAYIKNNQNVPFSLYATKTKSGEAIASPDIYEGDFFKGQGGTYLSSIGNLYQGYRIYDVMRFLVAAISDNKVTFESDYLSTPDIQLFIYDGFALSHPNRPPEIVVTLRQLIDELYKIKNTSFYIDQSDPDAPVLRFENADWFYLGYTVMSFDEPLHIKTSIKTNKLFGTARVGSEYNPGGAADVYTMNAGQSYFGFKEEVYTPVGQCNLDNELDLVSQFYISNNAINDQVNGVVGSNFEDLFIVEMYNVDTVAFTADAYPYQIYGTDPKRYYNLSLNNVNKITTHGGNFQTALSNTQDPSSDICHISLGTDMEIYNNNSSSGNYTGSPFTLIPVPFADEFGGNNYDGGGNWDNTQFYYEAPLPGDYSFKVELNIEVANTKTCQTGASIFNPSLNIQQFTPVTYGVIVICGINFYSDSSFTTLISTSTQVFNTMSDGTFNINLAAPITLPAGATARVFTTIVGSSYAPLFFGNTPLPAGWIIQNCAYGSDPERIVYALEDSYFECNGTPDGGLILAQTDPSLYKAKLHEFMFSITKTEFREIQSLPIGAFEFIKDGVTRKGWIEEMVHNNATGATLIKLISQDATT